MEKDGMHSQRKGPQNISVQNTFKMYLESNMTDYPLFKKPLENGFYI